VKDRTIMTYWDVKDRIIVTYWAVKDTSRDTPDLAGGGATCIGESHVGNV
jgi:hypothetical protein